MSAPEPLSEERLAEIAALIANGGDSHLPTNAETRLAASELLAEVSRLRAELAAKDEALREIVHRDATSTYSSIYAAPGEFAQVARDALAARPDARSEA